jgi:hypothetical protein
MIVYITKGCIVHGIRQAEVETCGTGMVLVSGQDYPQYLHGEGREWHTTFESAKRVAEDTVARKVASLNKQLIKLSKISFTEGGVHGL